MQFNKILSSIKTSFKPSQNLFSALLLVFLVTIFGILFTQNFSAISTLAQVNQNTSQNSISNSQQKDLAQAIPQIPITDSSANNNPYKDKNIYFRAKITQIDFSGIQQTKDPETNTVIAENFVQELVVVPTEGDKKNIPQKVTFKRQARQILEKEKLSVGDTVVIIQTANQNLNTGQTSAEYSLFVDSKYRLDGIYLLVGVFVILLLVVAGFRGLNSLLGLGLSVYAISQIIITQILAGQSPFWVSLWVAIVISVLSCFLAHGFNKRTIISVISILITLSVTVLFALWSVNLLSLLGVADENTIFLRAFEGFDPNKKVVIDLVGLLLGGIIIGTLGILDDVTFAQSTAVEEIYTADPTLPFWTLMKKGLNIGREHIASMVNTLAFAYVGVSLPMLVTIVITEDGKPWWYLLNNEILAEEIVRTLVGSVGIVLCVPIATILSAYFLGKYDLRDLIPNIKPPTLKIANLLVKTKEDEKVEKALGVK